MEQQLYEQNSANEEDSQEYDAYSSKSMQLLKRCIHEIGGNRDKTPFTQGKSGTKIAAPKPVRGRTIGLNHPANSKWLETSPIKNEMTQDQNIAVSDVDEQFFDNQSLQEEDLAEMRGSHFQNEQKLSQVHEMKKLKFKRTTSPMSELQSLMEAEKEFSAIFKNEKKFMKTGIINRQTAGWGALSPNISYSSTCSTSNMGNSERTLCHETNSTSSAVGFSNYSHFKAPIKRPSCNPIVKDEKFKRLNTVNEGNMGGRGLQSNAGDQIPCNLQAVINPLAIDHSSHCLINYPQQQFMFGYSTTTSPTAYSTASGMNVFSFNDTLTNSNVSHHHQNHQMNTSQQYPSTTTMNTCSHFNQNNIQQIQTARAALQIQSIQSQLSNMTFTNSAPESSHAYFSHFSNHGDEQRNNQLQYQTSNEGYMMTSSHYQQ